MTVEQIVLILVCANSLLFIVGMGVMAYAVIRTSTLLMWFHKAGTNMAQHQEELARIAVKDKEADVAMIQAQAAQTAAEAQKETKRMGPNSAVPQRLA